jgi:hypothetical protein
VSEKLAKRQTDECLCFVELDSRISLAKRVATANLLQE